MLAAAADGDEAAFRVLVNRHLPSVLAVARRMLRDEAEAEDMAQDIFERGAEELELKLREAQRDVRHTRDVDVCQE